MTNEQINRAIAEECGWTQISDDGMVGKAPGETCNRVKFIPDFCSNLNAMHEAEKQLWRKDWNLRYDYVDELGKILNPTVWHRMSATDMLDANARERAEAFLRTLGKWEEVQA